jgi:hypothetical protein
MNMSIISSLTLLQKLKYTDFKYFEVKTSLKFINLGFASFWCSFFDAIAQIIN